MNRTTFSMRRLTGLAVLALVAGAAGAQAASSGSSSPSPVAPRAASPVIPAAPAPVDLVPRVAPYMTLAPRARAVMPVNCRPPGKQPAAAPPTEALKNAFGVLRRERTDDDALPDRALAALKARGLEAADPQAARLLRADRRARAWVVPVPDVAATPTVVCRGAAARRAARARALGRAPATPREGLAVVSVGGAPGGGGGALADLQRGLAGPTVDPCAGTGHDMLGISGIVPDGVDAVFVTSADGSATRADVRDNGYAFVLPRSRRPESRYVVWTGANGTPHVLPLAPVFPSVHPGACRGADTLVRVTPEAWDWACAPVAFPAVLPARPSPGTASARARRTRALRRLRGGLMRAVPVPPAAAAPLPLALAACRAIGAPPVLQLHRGPASVLPRAVPPPRPRVAPRAVAVPTVPAVPRPVPPRGP